MKLFYIYTKSGSKKIILMGIFIIEIIDNLLILLSWCNENFLNIRALRQVKLFW